MSLSGYNDDLDSSELAMYRGTVASAIRGKRGQAFLRELLATLDAMPDKKLIQYDLKDATGQVCTLGAICVARGLDTDKLDPENHKQLGATFNIARQLVAEIEFENDEFAERAPPEARWQRMRDWVASKIVTVRRDDAPQPHQEHP